MATNFDNNLLMPNDSLYFFILIGDKPMNEARRTFLHMSGNRGLLLKVYEIIFFFQIIQVLFPESNNDYVHKINSIHRNEFSEESKIKDKN
jgi:hypothetical protein